MARLVSVPCGSCKRKFGGHESYTRHFVPGSHQSKCRTDVELRDKGFKPDRYGVWVRSDASLSASVGAQGVSGALALAEDVRTDWERHADTAAQLESKGDEHQWEAAREYAEAKEAGASLRQIGERVGKSHKHIDFMLRASVYHGTHPDVGFAEAYALAKQPEREPRPESVIDLAPPPDGQFRTILADPPWQYDNKGTRGAVGDVAVGKKFHYDTMPLEEIAALEVPAADDAHLYLWTTNSFLRPAFDVMAAWGFEYKTCLTWCKPQIGMGNYFRNNTEHVLFGVRGKLPTNVNDVGTWFEAKRGRHSAKPETFLDLLESASPGPYFEMFARATGQLWKREGWTYWGNEA